MKFIKYAVGLVIALSVIPLVVVVVNNLDQQTKLTTVEFEVTAADDGAFMFSDYTYNTIDTLSILDVVDNETIVINLLTTKLNGIELTGTKMLFDNDVYAFFNHEAIDWEDFSDNDSALSAGYSATIGDKWEMTFEVPRPLPPLVKLLVGFAPLLFVGGILLFMLNKSKLT